MIMKADPHRTRMERLAELLDRKDSGWEERLEPHLEKLDIANPNRCVCGLLYGDYDTGMRRLGFTVPRPSELDSETNARFMDEGTRYGVNGTEKEMPILTEGWRTFVRKRLAEKRRRQRIKRREIGSRGICLQIPRFRDDSPEERVPEDSWEFETQTTQ
jgi:hypothetical protein